MSPRTSNEPETEAPRRVRKKGQPRHASNIAPEPKFRSEYCPFSIAETEALIRKVKRPLVEGQTIALVADNLNLEARRYDWRAQIDRQPTERMVIKSMKKLAKCARALQAELPLLISPSDENAQNLPMSPAHGLIWPLRLHLPETMDYRPSQGRQRGIRTPQPGELWLYKEDANETQQMIGANFSEKLVRDLSEWCGALAEACDLAVEDSEECLLSANSVAENQTAIALKFTVRDLLDLYSSAFGRKPTISKDSRTARPIGPALRFVQGALQVMDVETSDENILRLSRRLHRS